MSGFNFFFLAFFDPHLWTPYLQDQKQLCFIHRPFLSNVLFCQSAFVVSAPSPHQPPLSPSPPPTRPSDFMFLVNGDGNQNSPVCPCKGWSLLTSDTENGINDITCSAKEWSINPTELIIRRSDATMLKFHSSPWRAVPLAQLNTRAHAFPSYNATNSCDVFKDYKYRTFLSTL